MLRTLVVSVFLSLPCLFIPEAVAVVPMLATGEGHSVALRSDGQVITWGSNAQGQLGIASSDLQRSTPIVVPGMNNVIAIAAGPAHSVALKQDGSVWTWGFNDGGQLGDGTITDSRRPLHVQGLSEVVAIAAGGCQTLALKQDGTVWRMGLLSGSSTTTCHYAPLSGYGGPALAQVPELDHVVAIAAGDYFFFALKQDGTVWAWGSRTNTPGLYIGDVSLYLPNPHPFQIPDLANIIAISTSDSHAVALRQDGSVWTWGNNHAGELGDGTVIYRLRPVQMIGLDQVRAIAATRGATMAVKQDGSVWVAGAYDYGLGGYNNTGRASVAQQVAALGNIQSIASGLDRDGFAHTLAMQTDGLVLAWGFNHFGEVGDGTSVPRNAPTYVANETAAGPLNVNLPEDPGNRYLVDVGGDKSHVDVTLRNLLTARNLADGYLTLPDVFQGMVGEVYLTAFHRDAGGSFNPVSFGRDGFQRTAPGTAAVPIYSGPIRVGNSWSYPLENSASNGMWLENTVICMGITFPELAAKGMVLMRRIYASFFINKTELTQCPMVQTPMTAQLYQGQVAGPLTAKSIVARINPLDEDRGKVRNVYSWAVAHFGTADTRVFMQTANGWQPMVEPVQPAMTLTVPASGPVTLTVAEAADLSGQVGMHFYVGLGTTWDEVRLLNKTGLYYTLE